MELGWHFCTITAATSRCIWLRQSFHQTFQHLGLQVLVPFVCWCPSTCKGIRVSPTWKVVCHHLEQTIAQGLVVQEEHVRVRSSLDLGELMQATLSHSNKDLYSVSRSLSSTTLSTLK